MQCIRISRTCLQGLINFGIHHTDFSRATDRNSGISCLILTKTAAGPIAELISDVFGVSGCSDSTSKFGQFVCQTRNCTQFGSAMNVVNLWGSGYNLCSVGGFIPIFVLNILSPFICFIRYYCNLALNKENLCFILFWDFVQPKLLQ
jgi:hypothetical protein